MTFLTIFLLTMPNATAKTIGLLTLVGQLIGFIAEVPSGYISDRIGHKNALILSRSAIVLSTLMYVLSDSIIWFFAGAIFLAIGWAFESGTNEAFMQDTLAALGRSNKYASIVGKIKSIGFAVPVAFILLLAFVAESNFRTAFLIALVIDVIGLLAVILLEKPPVEEHVVEEVGIRNIGSVSREFFSLGWLPYVIAGVLFIGVLLGVSIGFKNPYQEMLGFSISMLGILWALSRIIISIVLLFNGKIYKRFSFKQFLILEATIVGLALLGIGLTTNMWVVAILFIFTNVPLWGLASARQQYYLEFIKNSHSKATLISIKELLIKLVTGGVAVLMGLLVSNVLFQNAYLIAGLSFVLLITGIMLFVPRSKNIKAHV